MTHEHQWADDYLGVPRCYCGERKDEPWVARPEDLKRWTGMRHKVLNALKYGRPVSRSILSALASVAFPQGVCFPVLRPHILINQ